MFINGYTEKALKKTFNIIKLIYKYKLIYINILVAIGTIIILTIHKPYQNEIYDIFMTTYYGGRSEVKTRKQQTQIAYLDFLPQYHTAPTPIKTWSLITADAIEINKARDFIQSLLDIYL